MNGAPSHRFLFFSGEASADSRSIALSGPEHHHLSRVLRMTPGDTVYVTNGRGVILRCRVQDVDRREARLQVLGVEERESGARPVILALALLRKDAFERAVELCTELGISECLPFISERSHLKTYSDAYMKRLRRLSFSAAKQSFRSVMPPVEDPVTFDGLLLRLSRTPVVIVGDDGGAPPRSVETAGAVTVVVGPEGGLSERERAALAEAGARPIRVGRHRLRSETAAAALVSIVVAEDAVGPPSGDPIDRASGHPLD